jgi:hypothetical protein
MNNPYSFDWMPGLLWLTSGLRVKMNYHRPDPMAPHIVEVHYRCKTEPTRADVHESREIMLAVIEHSHGVLRPQGGALRSVDEIFEEGK